VTATTRYVTFGAAGELGEVVGQDGGGVRVIPLSGAAAGGPPVSVTAATAADMTRWWFDAETSTWQHARKEPDF
jgi:hypothetical protein